tara:strand:+ start:624 stop:1058 length:435 start_codon:yes stop_codon:yes gene_type:complete
MTKLQLTPEISTNIIKELMNGKPLTRICQDKANPSLSKVYDWIAEDKEFAEKILTARKIAAQTYLDKMIEELEFADNKNIAVVREKLHHYRWMASKLIGIYGDKQEIKQDTNIQITWSNTDQENYKDVTNSVSSDSANSVSHTT